MNAFTGEPLGEIDSATGVPKGKTVFEGEHQAAFLVPFENCGTQIKVLAVVDENQVSCKSNRIVFSSDFTNGSIADRPSPFPRKFTFTHRARK